MIEAFWVSNGTVKLKLEEGDTPISIEHHSRLVQLFPRLDFAAPMTEKKEQPIPRRTNRRVDNKKKKY